MVAFFIEHSHNGDKKDIGLFKSYEKTQNISIKRDMKN